MRLRALQLERTDASVLSVLGAPEEGASEEGETVLKEKPMIFTADSVRAILDNRKTQTRRVCHLLLPGDKNYINCVSPDEWHEKRAKQAPYPVGTRVWVKETFNVGWLDGGKVLYRADGGSAKDAGYPREPKWSSPIFMPRWASRITLEITEVRVQRVQEISIEDALAEGYGINANGCFPKGWDYINAKRGYSWESNPFVWCYTFRRVEQ